MALRPKHSSRCISQKIPENPCPPQLVEHGYKLSCNKTSPKALTQLGRQLNRIGGHRQALYLQTLLFRAPSPRSPVRARQRSGTLWTEWGWEGDAEGSRDHPAVLTALLMLCLQENGLLTFPGSLPATGPLITWEKPVGIAGFQAVSICWYQGKENEGEKALLMTTEKKHSPHPGGLCLFTR